MVNSRLGDELKIKRSEKTAAAAKSLQPCPTLRPHRRQPTRLPRPWDSPGKNTGVGCHFLLPEKTIKDKIKLLIWDSEYSQL